MVKRSSAMFSLGMAALDHGTREISGNEALV